MRISDWSSDVCSSDLILAIIVIVPLAWLKKFILIYVDIILDAISAWLATYYVDTLMFVWNFTFTVVGVLLATALLTLLERKVMASIQRRRGPNVVGFFGLLQPFADGLKLALRSEEHTSELQSLMRSSYDVICLKKKKNTKDKQNK